MSQVSDLTFALLNILEGLRLHAYQDEAHVWTIGYGHTKDVKEGDICTSAQARIWMDEDLAPLYELIYKLAPKVTSIVAQSAYASFGYNCGLTSLQHVLSGKARISEFIHIGNKVSDDLVIRRALEQALIDSSKGENK